TVFNASDEPITEAIDGMAGLDHRLHEVQADGADEVVKGASWDAGSGTVTVPAHTVAVFVAPQVGDDAPGDGEEPGGGDEPGDGVGGPAGRARRARRGRGARGGRRTG